MYRVVGILFLLCVNLVQAQQDIFDVARNGTVEEMKKLYTDTPEVIDQKNEYGYTPFLLACYNGNAAIVQYLVDKVADVNGVSKYGTPLMAAVYKRDEKIVSILLKHGVDVNKTDAKGTTALHYAMLFNNTSIAKKLINAGAKANLKDNTGKTAYDYAMNYKNEEIITLMKNKAL